MSNNEIIKLCGHELGSEGKVLSRDSNNYQLLIERLKQQILTVDGKSRWIKQTGLNSLIESMNNLIFSTV